MNRNYFMWVLIITFLSVFLIFYSMWQTAKPPVLPPAILTSHPVAPYPSFISAVGLVEASSDNISIGSPVNRIIDKVLVQVGEEIRKGQVLFTLENLDLQAELSARLVDYEIAESKYKKMKALPRQEDLIAVEASLKNAQIELDHAQNRLQRVQGLRDSRALSQQDINSRELSFEQAQTRLQEAQANFNKIKSGTWEPDLQIALLEVKQAQTNIERIKTEIERTYIRSPIDGKVLQIKIHEGESPLSIGNFQPLMIVGNTDEMYLKASINQFDAPYFKPEAPAMAFLRGNPHLDFPLEFIRLEPYLVNKQNLTNDIIDKVDTRVLQVIYRINNKNHNLFVGQQMDVFIEAEFPS